MSRRVLFQSHGLPALLLAAVVAVTAASARAESPASPASPEPAVEHTYRHAPVSLWIIPNLSGDGLGAVRLKTNLALSLGMSGYAVLHGVDLGVGASWVTETARGAQLTAGFNYVGGDAVGAQLSAGANVVRGALTGAQVAGGVNVVADHGRGLQMAGGVNFATAFSGAQLSVINVGGDVTGAQLGVINIARRVRGLQLGVVNLAEESSAPVGLLNLVSKGEQHLALWGTDSVPLNVGVKLGSRHVYSVLAAGFETSGGKRRWLAGIGLGVHVPVTGRFYVEGDVLTWHVNEDRLWSQGSNSLHAARLVGGYRLYPRLSFFAGATFNVSTTPAGAGEGFGLIRGVRLSAEGAATTVRAWPGFVGGVQF